VISENVTFAGIILPPRVREFKTVMQLYLMTPFAATGIICNILSITTLKRDKSMIPTTSLLLQMLSASDLLSLLFQVPLTIKQVVGISQRVQDLMDGFLAAFYFTWYTTSVWLGVLLTAERYVAVCYPLHIGRLGTLSRIRAAGISVWCLAFFVNIWHFLQKQLTTDENGNLTLKCWLMCESQAYGVIYYGLLFPAVVFYVPLGLLIFFTTRILSELRKAYKENVQLTSDKVDAEKRMSTRHRRATVTLVSIVLVFLVIELVNNVTCALIAVNFVTDQAQIVLYQIFLAISALMLAVQSTLNFFLFALTGKKYRQVLRDGLRCRKCK
jgi:hypothetical protein